MDLLNEVPVTLVVKAPNQKVADQTVECALNWTVRKLKEHLARVYPSNPTESEQRIIYSGRLLQDDVTLKDVLRQHGEEETVHTVHLVCSNPMAGFTANQNSPCSTTNPTASEGLRHRQVAAPETRHHQQENASQQPQHEQQLSAAANDTTDRLQYPTSAFYQPQYNPFMSSYLPPGAVGMLTPPAGLSSTPYSMEQMLWLQQQQQQHQAYVQYMTNYMQFFHQGMVAQPLSPGQPFQPFVAPPAQGLFANQNAAAPNQAGNGLPAGAAQQQPPVMRMNAQGGPVNDDDDDDMDRDWLDWFYVAIRFVLLICILYFYSTPTRFLATGLVMLFVYLFQTGWFRVFARLRGGGGGGGADAPPAAANGEEQQPVGDGMADDPQSAPAADNQMAQPARGLALAWSVLVSFFASLAPQPPPPINAN